MTRQSPINVLYISYDGMTDSLGQSQVIPYLIGLSKKGYRFSILSFEKKESFQKSSNEISELLKHNNIEWYPLSYTKTPPVISTLWDLCKMKREAYKLHREKTFHIVHCRSYVSSLVGVSMKKRLRIKFIFDMRAFYADERIDGGIWNLKNPAFKSIYRFFKRKEIEFLNNADYTITLTNKARDIIHSWGQVVNQPIPIEVIPCCADFQLYNTKNVDANLLQELRGRFHLSGNEFVLSYLGSIGTWYMLDEMLDFFQCLLQKNPGAKFLFITNEPEELIRSKAKARHIDESSIIISYSPRHLVPTYLALSDWSIFFIQPVFSKSGSSPTKQGEIMGMGIPHVCNAGVGDVDEIMNESKAGVLVQEFTSAAYYAAIGEMLNAQHGQSVESIVKSAHRFYSLEMGVQKYEDVYNKIL